MNSDAETERRDDAARSNLWVQSYRPDIVEPIDHVIPTEVGIQKHHLSAMLQCLDSRVRENDIPIDIT